MADPTPIDPTDDMFAGLKKKKTKKLVNFDDENIVNVNVNDDQEGGSKAPPSTPSESLTTPSSSTTTTSSSSSRKNKSDALGNDEPVDDNVNDQVDMFADLKKKKKKKRDIPMDLDAPSPSGTLTPTQDLNEGTSTPTEATATTNINDATTDATNVVNELSGEFGDLKKKKKSSKKKAAFDLEAFEKEIGAAENEEETAPTGTEDLEVLDGDLGDDVFTGSGGIPGGSGTGGDEDGKDGLPPWAGSDRDYTYQELLGRFYYLLHHNNPELMGDRRKLTLVPPSVAREGTKKTVFANLADICKRMHRQPKHVMEFLFAELGTSGSVDGNQRLIIKGRYTQKSMENVLRRYIVEYVVCKTCKSPDTLLSKDNRLYFVHCQACGSRRSVTAIKTGFQAQIGKRSKTKPE